MDVQKHTTAESRHALREYFRNRRMTSSIHLSMAAVALEELEEALHLLRGIEHPNATWADEVERFLGIRGSSRPTNQGPSLPGLL
ncbi:hypothetical protein [Geothrix sp. PMB-07]|uniref:hypothetical protein n=1 Tax=Geothrix sp. PMB-07 TaxID=3068640 RepID=UPI00274274C5|nr:hypothetical protein [Geothrix sp. PMB-07]WLT31134.1 hypothetical protein Q9293_15565 [Geothrix sp. PMB-07]